MPTLTTVAPYDRPMDVNVIMTVLHPQPIKGLGNILLLNATTVAANSDSTGKDGKSAQKTPAQSLPDTLSTQDRLNGLLLRKTDPNTGAIYREYKNLDAVSVDYDESTAVYKKATAYFAQPKHSNRLAVLDFDKSKTYDSLKAFWYFNWTFGVCVDNTIDDTTTQLSNIFEVNKDHFLVLQTEDLSKYNKMSGQNYTIGLKHSLTEAMDAAFVGGIALYDVGSITWKFKQLEGITPENLTSQELAGINNIHVIAYEEMMGKGQTSEGTTLSGEYIDLLHGVMWVQTECQSRLQKLLQDNGKIPYEARGIAMINATITDVLNEAFQKGIIATDDTTGHAMFSVTTTPRSEQSREDLSARHYGGVSFEYHASSAIHTITVNGTVDSDTIIAA